MLKALRLPTPALVISVLALVAAVGGGTFAIAALNGSKVKKIAKRQANKAIRSKAASLSVRHAQTADTAEVAGSAGSAYSTFHTSGLSFPDTFGPTIATLDVPEVGQYVIVANLTPQNAGAPNNGLSRCALTAGADDDQAFFGIPNTLGTTVSLQIVHEFDTPGSVDLRCADGGNGDVEAFSTRITAIQVANLSNVGF